MTTLLSFKQFLPRNVAVLIGIALICLLVGLFPVVQSILASDGPPLTEPRWLELGEYRGGVNLRWFRVQGAVSYSIQRRTGEDGDFIHLGNAVNPLFEDFKITPGQVYFYTIVAVGRDGAHGKSSEIRFIKLTPPEPEAISPPAWTSHQVRREGIALSWAHDTPDRILAFNLYRRQKGESSFSLITSTLDTTFLDRDVYQGNQYEYLVSALDRNLGESDNSKVLDIHNETPVLSSPGDARLQAIKTLEEVVTRTELVTEFTSDVYDFISPVDVDYVASEQKLYVSDSGTGLIMIIGSSGEIIAQLGGNGKQPWNFERLLGIEVDARGYVYAVDAYKGEIVVFSSRGNFDRRIKLEQEVLDYFGPGFHIRYPWFRFGLVDLLSREDGTLLVVDNPNGWIYVLNERDEIVRVVGTKGDGPGEMHYPTFAALGPGSRIVVSDTLNSRVQIFDADGKHHGFVGERGLGIGQFLRPKGVAVSRDGSIYVVDSQHNVIQSFGPDGEFVSLLANERGLPIDLGSPNGLVFVEPDLLIICEKLSRRVQVRKILPESAGQVDRPDTEPHKKP